MSDDILTNTINNTCCQALKPILQLGRILSCKVDNTQILPLKDLDNAMLFWTAVIALATIVYVFFAAKLWSVNLDTLRLTKQIFESTNRPFLFTDMPELALSRTTYPSLIKIIINNKGHIPSSDVMISFRATYNDIDITKRSLPSEPLSIFPNSYEERAFEIINNRNELFVLHSYPSRANSLDVFLIVKYQGIANQQYATDCHYHYDAALKRFTTVNITWT